MAIDSRFIVDLRGKSYPTWPGVLDAAHKAGLRSLTTELLQVPSESNGMTAIVKARAEFEGGRVFEDLGDCSPASTSPMLAAASIRLASTRAKGRVLRDAVNIGQTLLEELPDLDAEPAPQRNGHAQREPRAASGQNGTSNAPQTRQTGQEAPPMTCADDGKPLTRGQYEVSLRAYSRPLCPSCQKAAAGRN
jgi:hypothetical protein